MASQTKIIADNCSGKENDGEKNTNPTKPNDVSSCSSPQNPLKPWNTFRLESYAARISVAENIATLCQYWIESTSIGQPTLLLGEGSNILFIEDFLGHVIINRIKGIKIAKNADNWLLHVGAGENWHHLVEYTLSNGMPGLENLALIPGCVGSAPIQNIGAYGVELANVCDYVDMVYLPNGKPLRLTAQECDFGYRDSVFKHRYRDCYAIIAIGLRLAKTWQPILSYADLNALDLTATPQEIFYTVCLIRQKKLPDPKVIGNAGSFFKNPLVSAEKAAELKSKYPRIACYPQNSGNVKVAAGWLIDQCGLKGFSIGGASVHDKQALVIINSGTATGRDIFSLAQVVQQRVADKFNVCLESEVRFIGAHGEINTVKLV